MFLVFNHLISQRFFDPARDSVPVRCILRMQLDESITSESNQAEIQGEIDQTVNEIKISKTKNGN